MSYITGESLSEPEIITSIVEELQKNTKQAANAESTTTFFVISVFSNAEDALFEGGSVPVWKWARPNSVYDRKAGFWEIDISSAIENGEFEGGMELYLLVRGIPEGRRQEFLDQRIFYFQ
jgi:hypothetical protein